MEENITQDMFNALDLEKKGSVSKQHLINQMADYFSQNNVRDEAVSEINILNRYPDFINYEHFKQIYLDLTKANILEEDDEDEEVLICSMYEEIIKGNGSDSEISDNEVWSRQECDAYRFPLQNIVIDMTKPPVLVIGPRLTQNKYRQSNYNGQVGGARGRTIDTTVSVKSNIGVQVVDDGKEDFDELSYMTDSGMSLAAEEEVDKLADNYKSVVTELSDLRYQLEDSTLRYVNQREITKTHSDRILMLEEQIRQLENMQQEQIELKRKENRSSKNIIEQRKSMELEEQVHRDGLFRQGVLTRLNTLESEYNASNAEYERMKQASTVLMKEKSTLEKKLKFSEQRFYDLELTIKNYKSAVTLQMSELQRERDNAEKINKQLYCKLQDARLSCKYNESEAILPSSSTGNSPIQSSPQSWTGPFNIFSSHSSGSKHSLESGGAVSSTHSCTTISQLERVVHCLTMDNRNLVEKVSHLETLEFYQRQRKFLSNNMSLASEMEELSVTDLRKSLVAEREIAKRLQLYIMGLTNRLMLAGYIEAFRH